MISPEYAGVIKQTGQDKGGPHSQIQYSQIFKRESGAFKQEPQNDHESDQKVAFCRLETEQAGPVGFLPDAAYVFFRQGGKGAEIPGQPQYETGQGQGIFDCSR
jgi:hypothetical protein